MLEQHKKAYLVADLRKLTEEYDAIDGDEAREAYIHSRKQKVRDIVSVMHQSRHVEVMLMCLYISSIRLYARLGQDRRTMIGSWSCANFAKRGRPRELIEQLSMSYVLHVLSVYPRIIGKLQDLGWGQDIASIRYPDSLAQNKLVDRPQRLTEKSQCAQSFRG
jgi:hypothetical protein